MLLKDETTSQMSEELGKGYLKRWVINFGLFSIRLHHWRRNDDSRHFHNHPWWYLTFVLAGGYWDVSPIKCIRMSKFSLKWFPRDHWHYIKVDSGGCWTIMITGKRTRTLQFWVRRIMNSNKYFFKFGEHE